MLTARLRGAGWLLAGLLGCRLALASPAPAEAAYVLQQATAPIIALSPNPHRPGMPWLRVSIAAQTLTRYDALGRRQQVFRVATATLGAGAHTGSYQTPLGWHQVCDKIGAGAAADSILYHRAVTPWHYSAALHAQYPQRDWILARILWLCGMEPGKNQGGEVDSHDRAIYIHGTGTHVPMGIPSSRGCIRMTGDEVVQLFDLVDLGTDVVIE